MSDIDTVAEAIGAADTGPMDGLYRRMAQAAIDALQLREETRLRGLYRGDDPALKYTEARLAGPWVRVEEQP